MRHSEYIIFPDIFHLCWFNLSTGILTATLNIKSCKINEQGWPFLVANYKTAYQTNWYIPCSHPIGRFYSLNNIYRIKKILVMEFNIKWQQRQTTIQTLILNSITTVNTTAQVITLLKMRYISSVINLTHHCP